MRASLSERRKVVSDLQFLKLLQEEWPSLPKPCHTVEPLHEDNIVEMLLDSGMATLLPEALLPRSPSGEVPSGGLFYVAKDAEQDRLIFDRRPQNYIMKRFHWLQLPSGSCFCRMRLHPNQVVRGSGDDLKKLLLHVITS